MRPAFAGSGGPEPEEPVQDNRTLFPNNPDLVNDISNAALLKELLPALEKFNCLDAGAYKGRRSPWVRAFCDLYHPAGPWGETKFKNVPNQTSKIRHSFKSYKIPKIFELLEKCGHLESSEPHKQLYDKLKDFESKEIYYKKFTEACKDLALEQSRKPPSERAPVPKTVVELTENAPAEQPPPNNVIILDVEGPGNNVQDQGNETAMQHNDSAQQEQNHPVQLTEVGANQEREDPCETIQERNNSGQQETNKSSQPIEVEVNQESEDNSEAIQEHGTKSNSAETSDTDAAIHGNAEGPNAETVDGEGSFGNNFEGEETFQETNDAEATQNIADAAIHGNAEGPNAETVDDEASFGNNFEGEETFEETNDTEAAQNIVESTNSIDETPLNQVSRNDAPLDDGGEKRVASNPEMPSPKRQRLETDKPVSDVSPEPSSPDPKQISAAPVRAVSPDTQRGASDDREQLLNRKREKLSNMLKQRESRYGQEDKIIEKLHKEIEKIDEELLELILAVE